jgi:hypothetical protein
MTTDTEGNARTNEKEEPSTANRSADGTRSGPVVDSSRDSLAGAGWICEEVGKFRSLVPPEGRPFSWLSLAPLWQSRNQILGNLFGDPTNDERRTWMEIQRGKLQRDLIIEEHAQLEKFSFIVVGDTGEGDASQFAVVPPLLEVGRDTSFMVICSDVIYPAGDANQYEYKFYRPYEEYMKPIYAIPGNHDWYDGLNGFMYHLCGSDAPQERATESGTASKVPGWKEHLRWWLWRKPTRMDPTVSTRKQVWRSLPTQQSSQRSPYFAIQTGPLLIVGIDTGINGDIDREQGKWLQEISKIDKPKLLLTGKPIYVDGEYHPGVIECGGTVDEIVRFPQHRYVAAIGGDIHNYQRYRVKMEGHEEPFYYIVSGGGGAYMSATHKIPLVSLPGIKEDEEDGEKESPFERNNFICYPRRGDSLSFYSKLYDRKFGLGKGWFEIPPNEAAAYMAKRLGIEPARTGDKNTYVSRRAQRVAEKIFPLPGRGRGPLHHYFSEFFDWNDPPLFKNFLRLDVSARGLDITCYGVTGCASHEQDPTIEDRVPTIPL